MESQDPQKVQECSGHGNSDGEMGGSVHHRPERVQQVPQHQAVLAQQVKRAHSLVILVHQGEEEEWGDICDLVGESGRRRLRGSLEENILMGGLIWLCRCFSIDHCGGLFREGVIGMLH